MEWWKKLIVDQDDTILDVMKIIDDNSQGTAMVVNKEHVFLGTTTDGDIRRAILRGVSLNEKISAIMNTKPIVARTDKPYTEVLLLMRQKYIKHLPVINERGVLVKVEAVELPPRFSIKDNWVVLMAGGLGTRLYPLTQDYPKPLLKIGDKPILETVIINFIEQGFHKFFISVNYKAEMIQDYFGDGSKWGVTIEYLKEQIPLGTAGALSLLPDKPSDSLIIMNSDLLTKVYFPQLLNFHKEHNSSATMCTKEYDVHIPYGVIEINEKYNLTRIVEKPTQRFLISAGIYVLEPHMLSYIPKDTFVDMPNIFDMLVQKGHVTTVFPIREYWIDIGRMADLNRANSEFKEIFG